MRAWALLCLVLATPARAERVIAVAPVVRGEGMLALGAEVALALDRALPQSPRFTRVGQGNPTASELATALGCASPDEQCLREAASAAGASLALVVRLTRAGAVVGASLERLPADPLRPAFRVQRRIDLGQAALDDALLARLGRILADDLLAGDPQRPAALVAAEDLPVQIDGRRHDLGDPLELAPGRYEVAVLGGTPRPTDLLPGELVVVTGEPPQGSPRGGPSGRRIGAWMTLGVGAASLAGAGFMGAQVAGTQSDYDRARTGAELREFQARGEGQALAANLLLGVGAAALAVSIWLFWE